MTTKEYKALLERIEVENPGEPLLPLLRTGATDVNQIYMRSAAKRLAQHEERLLISEVSTSFDPEMSEILSIDEKSDIWQNDPQWLAMTADIRRAYNAIRKTRNKYHSCQNDEMRATVANEVATCWHDIQVSINRRQAYENTGIAVTTVADGADELPGNPVDLAKRLASIRVQITQTKNRIQDIAASNEVEKTKQERLQKAEASLQRLKNLRGLAEERLKTLQAE